MIQFIKFYFAKGLRAVLNRPALKKCILNKHTRVCSGTQAYRVTLDEYSYIGHDCFLNNVSIGKFCSIADACKIGGARHQIGYVSTSPVFTRGLNILKTNFANLEDTHSQRTIIENDVWIGMNVLIQEGVHIGNGAVIGMGSVVTHDVPSYEIWAGNPARKIRGRFTEEISENLEKSKWWNYSEHMLRNYGSYFDDPEEFIKHVTVYCNGEMSKR